MQFLHEINQKTESKEDGTVVLSPLSSAKRLRAEQTVWLLGDSNEKGILCNTLLLGSLLAEDCWGFISATHS